MSFLESLKTKHTSRVKMSEYLLRFDCTNSFVLIFDLRDTDLLKLLKCITPTELQHTIVIIKRDYGARLSAIHFLTPSNLINILPVMSSKLAARVQCHATVEDLCTVLDRDILPTDLGDKQGYIDDLYDKWAELLCSEEVVAFSAERVASCTDESLREKHTLHEDSMGQAGSFRSLSY